MTAFDLDGTILTTHDVFWDSITDSEANELRMKQQVKFFPKEPFIIVTARSDRVAEITYRQLKNFGLDKLCKTVEFVGYDGHVPIKKVEACIKNGVELLVEDNCDTIEFVNNVDKRISCIHIDEYISQKFLK